MQSASISTSSLHNYLEFRLFSFNVVSHECESLLATHVSLIGDYSHLPGYYHFPIRLTVAEIS